jgi:hypothetical protein
VNKVAERAEASEFVRVIVNGQSVGLEDVIDYRTLVIDVSVFVYVKSG